MGSRCPSASCTAATWALTLPELSRFRARCLFANILVFISGTMYLHIVDLSPFSTSCLLAVFRESSKHRVGRCGTFCLAFAQATISLDAVELGMSGWAPGGRPMRVRDYHAPLGHPE